MLLYASVVERGYLAHCGANMALAYCHPRLIWSAAARWLRGSRDLQREIESERCMMREQNHMHLEWPESLPRDGCSEATCLLMLLLPGRITHFALRPE